MIRTCARSFAGVLALALFATLATAQSLEVHVGGNYFSDAPALDTPVWPGRVTFGPDGHIYVVSRGDYALLRLDAAGGTVSRLPTQGSRWPFKYIWDVAFGPDGAMYALRAGQVVKYDLEAGEYEVVAGALEGGGLPRSCYPSGWNGPSYPAQGSIAIHPNGNIYVLDSNSNWICAIGPWSNTSRAVGVGGWGGFGGDGGPAEYATLNYPRGMAFDAAGNLYISDTENHRIRKVSAEDGIINTIVGNGQSNPSPDGIPVHVASIGNPGALAVDAAGNIFVWEGSSQSVRRIDAVTGVLSTVAGNGEWGSYGDGGVGVPAIQVGLMEVTSIAVAANGDLYLSEMEGKRLRRVAFDTGLISTVLGNGASSFCGENAFRTLTCLDFPQGMAFNAQGDLFISDSGNQRIRKVSGETGIVTTIAGRGGFDPASGDGGPAIDATFGNSPAGLAFDAAGNLYIAGWWEQNVRRIDAATGIITTVAGTGAQGSSGDGGPATAATFNVPSHVAVDAAGNLYVSEANGYRVRRIAAGTGIITTFAGTGQSGGPLGDGGPAAQASVGNPGQLAFDAPGSLLIADNGHARLRKVDLATGIITTIAGNGTCCGGDGGPAALAGLGPITALVVDAGGNIYMAGYSSMRRIDARTGIIDSVPPGYIGLATPDGTTMEYPTQMAFDAQGRLFVADPSSDVIWQVKDIPPAITDSTPPTIQANVSGTAGDHGWYRGDVQVSWNLTDAESSVSSSSGCDTSQVTSDTTGITFTCEATSDGGSATQSVTIKRDTAPPTLNFGSITPAPDATGWNNSSVTVPYTSTDATSGVQNVNLPSPLLFNDDGASLFQQVVVTDYAGNAATFESPHVSIDRTPPVLQPILNGTIGNNGWYRSDVQVHWSISDIPSAVTGCEDTTISVDTSGATFNCTATSAGGTTSASVTIKRDATPPVLTFGTPSPVPNANGWNKTNVSIPFTRSDALSGLASTSTTSPLVVSAEGAAVTGQVVVTDNAGNGATFTSVARNIDKTAPVVTFTTPAEGATYGYYQDVVADYACTDVSLLSCTAPTSNGLLINTAAAGARTFKVTAKDAVAFTMAVTHNFTVESVFNFDGFLAPASAPPTLNLVTRGALVPVRWRLPDGRGGFVTNPASFTSATVASLSCGSAPVVPLNDTSGAPPGISFDASTSSFVYNWQTSSNWTGCRKLTIKLKDGSLHELRFRFQ